jgi:hypothetical protein
MCLLNPGDGTCGLGCAHSGITALAIARRSLKISFFHLLLWCVITHTYEQHTCFNYHRL